MNTRYFIFCCLLVCLLIGLPVNAQEKEMFELENISVLTEGESQADSFYDHVTAHLYAFHASEGDEIDITMVQQSEELDPYLVLLADNGKVLANDDDSGSSQLAAAIKAFEIPYDGAYYVLASTYIYIENYLEESDQGLEAPLEYELILEGNTPSEDDNIVGVQAIYLKPQDATDEVEGRNTVKLPISYYIYEGQAGDEISLHLSSDDFDANLQVFAPNGERIAVNDDAPGGTTTNSAIEALELPDDGLYLIFVTDLLFYNTERNVKGYDYQGGEFTLVLEVAE